MSAEKRRVIRALQRTQEPRLLEKRAPCLERGAVRLVPAGLGGRPRVLPRESPLAGSPAGAA